MNAFTRVALCVFTVALVAGCSGAKVTSIQPYEGPRLARPSQIVVYDLAASPADIPPGFAVSTQLPADATPPTADEIAVGRRVGAQIAKELVTRIRSWGLPAVPAAGAPAPRLNDIVLVGYFESVDSGSRAKRLALGFSSGTAELRTALQVYVMTGNGLRRLGSGTADSGGGAGSKGPGAAVPVAVTIATGNPVGLIVSSAVKIEGEASGRTTIEGAANRTTEEIAQKLREACKKQGWI